MISFTNRFKFFLTKMKAKIHSKNGTRINYEIKRDNCHKYTGEASHKSKFMYLTSKNKLKNWFFCPFCETGHAL